MNPATVMRAYRARQHQEAEARAAWRAANRVGRDLTSVEHRNWLESMGRLYRYERYFERGLYRLRWLAEQAAKALVTVERSDLDEAAQKLIADRDLTGCERKCGGQGYSAARVRRALEWAVSEAVGELIAYAHEEVDDTRSRLSHKFEEALERTGQDGVHPDDRRRRQWAREDLEKRSRSRVEFARTRERAGAAA